MPDGHGLRLDAAGDADDDADDDAAGRIA